MPHSQATALQQTVCKFHFDPQYHISHWGSTILGDSTLCTTSEWSTILLLTRCHLYYRLYGTCSCIWFKFLYFFNEGPIEIEVHIGSYCSGPSHYLNPWIWTQSTVLYHAHFSFHQTDAKWGLVGVGMFAYEVRFSMYALEKGEWHCRMKCKIISEITGQ